MSIKKQNVICNKDSAKTGPCQSFPQISEHQSEVMFRFVNPECKVPVTNKR